MEEKGIEGGKTIKIRKVGIVSIAKICAFFYVLIGLIAGIYLGIDFIMHPIMLPTSVSQSLLIKGIFILLPIIYGIIGFIVGLLCGLFYNFLSRKIGGIEIEI